MKPFRLRSFLSTGPAAALLAFALFGGGGLATTTGAVAQSLTSPAGQPRLTTPAGNRGKAARRGTKKPRSYKRG